MSLSVSDANIREWLACSCMSGTNDVTKKKAESAARKVLAGEPPNTRDRHVYSEKLHRHLNGVCCGAQGLIVAFSAPGRAPPEVQMLTEDDVVLAVRAHLETRGWTILSQSLAVQRGDDLVAQRGNVRLEIEAKGEGSSRHSSARFGQTFDKNQVNDHVGRALLRALKVVSLGRSKAAVAFPDNELHRNEIGAVQIALERLGLGVFLVDAHKKVSSSPDWA